MRVLARTAAFVQRHQFSALFIVVIAMAAAVICQRQLDIVVGSTVLAFVAAMFTWTIVCVCDGPSLFDDTDEVSTSAPACCRQH